MAKKKVVESDKEVLDRVWVPLAPLRVHLATLAKDGWETYPLGELLISIREMVNATKTK